ncbi:MAG TPA: 1,4-alpha-glucan branching protein domain-containing protein [Thermoleophilaceae bacterium]|nr:1,4-alpha-glucan branching protein domain-containing protein [Thermoleophilaceae bacterium]
MRDEIGDLAIVLHSQMPYVEGFGTYPFGEEWLFDAVARSYLPVLEHARNLTITVTPVLADQLEAAGVPERMEEFLRRYRLDAAEREAVDAPPELRPAAEAEAERYRFALRRLGELEGDPLAAFRDASRDRNLALIPSAATHAVLPLVATKAGRRLQIDAGLRSHRRRFGEAEGFWLPECAYRPGIEPLLAERGLRFFCTDQSAHEEGLEALAPAGTAAGPVAFPLDWQTVDLLWSERGYPSDPAYAEFHRLSTHGTRLWAIGGRPYERRAAEERAGAHAGEFAAAAAARLSRFRQERGKRGLLTFAIDTELLGHWWSEGPAWLDSVLRLCPEHRVRVVTLSEALERHEPEERSLRESTWGEAKDLRTWDSPRVADLAWAPRRLELRLLAAVGAGELRPAAAERAARELLALQSSDWAFMDRREQAGDYPYQRSTAHARALLEAIGAAECPEPSLRNLAPDLSLAPLLEP